MLLLLGTLFRHNPSLPLQYSNDSKEPNFLSKPCPKVATSLSTAIKITQEILEQKQLYPTVYYYFTKFIILAAIFDDAAENQHLDHF